MRQCCNFHRQKSARNAKTEFTRNFSCPGKKFMVGYFHVVLGLKVLETAERVESRKRLDVVGFLRCVRAFSPCCSACRKSCATSPWTLSRRCRPQPPLPPSKRATSCPTDRSSPSVTRGSGAPSRSSSLPSSVRFLQMLEIHGRISCCWVHVKWEAGNDKRIFRIFKNWQV